MSKQNNNNNLSKEQCSLEYLLLMLWFGEAKTACIKRKRMIKQKNLSLFCSMNVITIKVHRGS